MRPWILTIGLLAIPLRAVSQEDPYQTLRRVSRVMNVPAGALYGIWKKESNLLQSGWGTSADWYLARDLMRPGSECVTRYGFARCNAHWQALRSLCAQRRRNGTRVCNPNEVRTSYAFAMGPMQHMPGEHVEVETRPGGSRVWVYTARSIDFDRDGVFDLGSLADAIAATAIELREYKARGGSWRWAVNRYYGSQREGYYEGRWERSRGRVRYRRGVRDYWAAWCRTMGCGPARLSSASFMP